MSESNFRLVTAAAQIGAGETQMAQLCGTLNLHQVRGGTWAKASDRLTASVSVVAEQSRTDAREEERLLAFQEGRPVDADGDVPI
eukprot:7166206-Prymnesium_polylepis.1